MPATNHLVWQEVKDFSKGLWTADSSFLIPGTGFQTMTDCYPQPGGGVRAFFKPTTLTKNGLAFAGADHRPVWLESMEVHSSGRAWLLITVNLDHASKFCTAWLLTPGGASWTKIADMNTTRSMVTQYHTTTSAYFIVGEVGYRTVVPTTGATTLTAIGLDLVATYQSRLLSTGASAVTGGLIRNQIIYTDPGSLSFPAANYIDIFGDRSDDTTTITGFIPYEPQKLLVSTVGAGWFSIDGDITDPIITEMGSGHSPTAYSRMAKMDDGIVFWEEQAGFYIAQNNATSFDRIDNALVSFKMPSGPSAIDAALVGFARVAHFLFSPGGVVQDLDTGAWFSLSQGNSNTFMFGRAKSAGPRAISTAPSLVSMLQYAPGANTWTMPLYETDDSSSRYETFTVKTAPLRDPNHRRLSIREVQVNVKSFHAASTIAVTVDGVTRTSAVIPVGTDRLRFLFNSRAEYQDIQIVAASNTSGYEAPMIESFAVGSRPNEHHFR